MKEAGAKAATMGHVQIKEEAAEQRWEGGTQNSQV